MTISLHVRLFAICALCFLFTLSGCVSTRVSGEVLSDKQPRLQEVEISIRYATFSGGSTASSLGQRNLDRLLPYLRARLPVVFALNGIPASMKEPLTSDENRPLTTRPRIKYLVLTPDSASYNSRSGQTLSLSADLIEPKSSEKLWHGDISLATPGFGSFDEDLANKIAVKLLEQLRHDKVVRLSSKEIKTQPPAQ